MQMEDFPSLSLQRKPNTIGTSFWQVIYSYMYLLKLIQWLFAHNTFVLPGPVTAPITTFL